jgi:hypothetical protein
MVAYGATNRGEPTVPATNPTQRGFIHLGLDVAKDSIAVGILRPDDVVPDTERIFHDEASIRRLIGRFEDPRRLRACYEAGPTGYELHRLLSSIGVVTDVVAPSLIPRVPGDHVKTDRRDCRRLARLHRAGELTPIRVPTRAEEGVRDICRARQIAVEERRRARQRLFSFLLRHNEVYRDGTTWTARHEAWVATRHFEDPAVRSAFSYQAIGVSDRVGVVNHEGRTDPGKGTPSGPGDSRVTHHAADDANLVAASPRPGPGQPQASHHETYRWFRPSTAFTTGSAPTPMRFTLSFSGSTKVPPNVLPPMSTRLLLSEL